MQPTSTANPYETMLTGYQASLEELNSKIRAMRATANEDIEQKRRFAMYCQMRQEVRQSIRAISKYIASKQK